MSGQGYYEGACDDGPLEGRAIAINTVKGFVGVDTARGQDMVVIYNWDDVRGTFVHQASDALDDERLVQAQNDPARCVLVLAAPPPSDSDVLELERLLAEEDSDG